ncbi:MAG: hypothetical protein M1825_005233 [Sarcosagium campestre]|nr:MAG: hypothetical protein M1825_005233 [Sarcosagium campestre]
MSVNSFFGLPSHGQLSPRYEHELGPVGSQVVSEVRSSTASALINQQVGAMTTTTRPPVKSLAPLAALERTENQLQRDFHILLDAQAEGLSAGLVGGGDVGTSDASSDGGSNSAASTRGLKKSRVIPVRQPAKRRIGLRAARRGILMTMQEFADVKGEESRLLDSEIEDRDVSLQQAEAWTRKKAGLMAEIENIETDRDSRKAADLGNEERAIQSEMNELERRLQALRIKHRSVVSEMTQIENSVQSRLSSYKAALALAETQISEFLAMPRQATSSTRSISKQSNFMSLPSRRRTLEMANEHWRSEQKDLNQRNSAVGVEKRAMEEGASMWTEVIKAVTAFEDDLRREMRLLRQRAHGDRSMSLGNLRDVTPIGGEVEEEPHRGLEDLIAQMDTTVTLLQSRLDIAEERGWKLLICAVGAELEAFKEGREMLLETERATKGRAKTADVKEHHDKDLAGSKQGRPDLTQRRPDDGFHDEDVRSEDEDEGPHPDLLVSRDDA